jgi:hypothetical protein
MAWLLLGVKPCISTVVVMRVVAGLQLNVAVPVGISANWITGRLCPPLGGDEEDVPEEFEHAALIRAPAAARHTAACRSTAITPGHARSLAALRRRSVVPGQCSDIRLRPLDVEFVGAIWGPHVLHGADNRTSTHLVGS